MGLPSEESCRSQRNSLVRFMPIAVDVDVATRLPAGGAPSFRPICAVSSIIVFRAHDIWNRQHQVWPDSFIKQFSRSSTPFLGHRERRDVICRKLALAFSDGRASAVLTRDAKA